MKEGDITYDGVEIKRIRKDDLRQSLGMVLQDTHLFSGRFWITSATDAECIAAANLVNAHSFIRRLPQGY